VANPATYNFGTADFTIELWAKRNALGGTQRHLFSKCDSTLWQSGCKEFYFNPNNQLTFGSYATGDTLSSTIADTNWHHIAVTFTDSTNTLQIYVDGALVTTATKALEADSASHVVMVGNLKGNNTFSGLLDEVRIYSRVLTLAQIQADMATPITSPGSDTTPPSTVTGLTATAVSSSQINLSWTAATDNVGVTGYRVERCQGAGCTTFAQIATPTGTTFGNTGLTAATSYSYRVKAVDAANNVSVNYSNVASATTQAAPPDTTPPSTVTGFTATAVSATQINLSWTAATDNVGVTGYRLERCQGAGCTTFAQIATPTGTTFSNTGLTAATSYSYRVKAVDAASNVSVNYSNVASATTLAAADTTPPTAPGTLTATAASRSRINLTWAAATDNVGVTGYRVERCQGATCTNFVQIGTPTGTSFGDTGLTRSTTYRYRVRASDAAGNLGSYSGISTATTKK
jgi:chitodextrinase